MLLPRDAGWSPRGFDPNEMAANIVRARGLEVRCKWKLEEARFPEAEFDAITAIDSFYYVSNRYETLRTFYRLLRPSGELATRLTTKRAAFGLARAVFRSGPKRDAKLSRMPKVSSTEGAPENWTVW
jgi:ubiquinone/menaquinone biosynthesis C-methylase UbiE